MNENIKQFLDDYLSNPSPHYAVMINGKWGCGKTYFIQKWIEETNKQKADSIWTSVYVSLFGISNTKEIIKEIDKQLNPQLFKFKEKGKKLCSLVSKVVLKTDLQNLLNLEDDNKMPDLSISGDLSLFELFKSNDENEKESVFGNKVIVFDDFERCNIGIETFFGFINMLIEHSNCRVILIGDLTKIFDDEEKKKKFQEFSEKIIGREFTLDADTTNALDWFCENDYKDIFPEANKFIESNKQFVIDIFSATTYSNLRVLRQCLYDFCITYQLVEKKEEKFVACLSKKLLSCFLVAYLEFKCGQKSIRKTIEDYEVNCSKRSLNQVLGNNEDDSLNKDVEDIRKKYQAIIAKYQVDLLDSSYITMIVSSIKSGLDISKQINEEISEHFRLPSDLQVLFQWYYQENNVLIQSVHKIENQINESNETAFSWNDLLSIARIFINLQSKDLYTTGSETFENCKKILDNEINKINSREELFNVLEEIRYFSIETPQNDDFVKFIVDAVNDRVKAIPDRFTLILNDLNDSNIDSLFDASRDYDYFKDNGSNRDSLFFYVEPHSFADRIQKLNNVSKEKLISFLKYHYGLNYRPSPLSEGKQKDLAILLKVEKELKMFDFQLIDKYWINALFEVIDELKERDNNQKTISTESAIQSK